MLHYDLEVISNATFFHLNWQNKKEDISWKSSCYARSVAHLSLKKVKGRCFGSLAQCVDWPKMRHAFPSSKNYIPINLNPDTPSLTSNPPHFPILNLKILLQILCSSRESYPLSGWLKVSFPNNVDRFVVLPAWEMLLQWLWNYLLPSTAFAVKCCSIWGNHA